MLNDKYKTLPVAKRTRNQVDKMFMERSKEIKRQRKLEEENPSHKLGENSKNLSSFCGESGFGEIGLESSQSDEKEVEKGSLETILVNDSDDDVVFEGERGDANGGHEEREDTSLSFETSESSEDDHEKCDIVEDMSVEEEKEEDKLDEELENVVNGTSLFDDINVEKNDSLKRNMEFECVARRTRSRCNMESGKKIIENGTTGSPNAKRTEYESDDEILSSDGSDEDGPAMKSIKTKKGSEKGMKINQGAVNKSKRRKGRRFLLDDEVLKILAASILNKEEGSTLDDYLPELPTEEKLLLKFTFGMEECPPPEKTEEEKEMDRLWKELTMGLDVDDVPMIESDSGTSSEIDQATLCSKGKHEYILDEEIGVKCKYCSFVNVEIRHYVPPLVERPSRKSERNYDWMEDETFDEFQCHNFDFDSQSASISPPDLSGTVWNIVPGIRKGLHAHQIEGFEFLWKNIAGGTDLEKLKDPTSYNGGGGCVISHAPGTGKTRLAITFLQSYVKFYPTCRPVIIAPSGTLNIWEAEFQRWGSEVPLYRLCDEKLSGNENKAVLSLLSPGKQPHYKTVRIIKLYSWKMGGGVLVLSYKLFEELTGGCDSVWGALLELPGLVILDEGHTPRNSSSLIWQALSKIQTDKCVILSGTPFQNNFEELYNILCLVRPKFGDQIPSKRPRGRPPKKARLQNNWAYVTSSIIIDDKVKPERVEQVRKMIAPFVHVHKGSILQEKLPGLRDSVVFLEPSGVQNYLLDILSRMITKQHSLDLDYAVSLVSVHPYLLCLKRMLLKESIKPSKPSVDWSNLKDLRLDPKAGVKTQFLMELIRLSVVMDEKVLVFSQYIVPLNLIFEQLEAKFNWVLGREVLRMDGKHDLKHRHWAMNHFNDPNSPSRVMLASTKACCEGISLVGASRVVLLDVVWNPSVERQAISRAYRLGQHKVVYVYHLLISGTMEEEKYRRQAEKDLLSELVFCSEDGAAGHQKFPSTLLEDEKDKLLEQMVEGEKLKCIFNKIVYQPKETNWSELLAWSSRNQV